MRAWCSPSVASSATVPDTQGRSSSGGREHHRHRRDLAERYRPRRGGQVDAVLHDLTSADTAAARRPTAAR
ncbi:MAG TPA: hypothetical protein VME19_02910 [Streptosporangiaceae bacterium]|nr:hypothetical protein [Streptosporangiaceae bacterium]